MIFMRKLRGERHDIQEYEYHCRSRLRPFRPLRPCRE